MRLRLDRAGHTKQGGEMKTALWILVVVLVLVLVPWFKVEAQTPQVTLTWTATGDDGNVGTATSYQMRMSTVKPDTTGATIVGGGLRATTAVNSWWNAATVVSGMPVPQVAGTKQSVIVTSGITWGTTYYFIIKTCDEVPNCSGYSNLASKATGAAPDTTAPASIFDLIAN
jgi:hypothetical protein